MKILSDMRIISFLFMVSIAMWTCTPKVTEQTQQVDTPPVVVHKEGLSSCVKFQDIKNGDDIENEYVIYRDFIKLSQFAQAFERWQKVYKNAPAADGKRWTVYSDGIKIYQHYLEDETDTEKRNEYVERILTLYDEIGECYPEQADYVKARKAFDYYYKYPDRVTDDEKYRLFKEVIDKKQFDTPVFVLNPFTKLMADRFITNKIDTIEAQHYAKLVPAIIQSGIKKGEHLKSWITVKEYAIPYIERLEAIRGFFDCAHFQDKYISKFNSKEKTCEVVTEIYSKLRYGNCDKESTELKEIYQWLKEHDCISEPPSSDPCRDFVSTGYESLRDGEYQTAISSFEDAIHCSSSDKNKGTYSQLIAKIYYAHLKNFPKARRKAREAMKYRSDWGDPLVLIGKLYASSGPLCGPGTGFDSQVVTWVAIDKWNQAKRVDASVAAEANKLIRQYQKYMPGKEDLFQRRHNTGDSFKVKCWIQETTKVRAAP